MEVVEWNWHSSFFISFHSHLDSYLFDALFFSPSVAKVPGLRISLPRQPATLPKLHVHVPVAPDISAPLPCPTTTTPPPQLPTTTTTTAAATKTTTTRAKAVNTRLTRLLSPKPPIAVSVGVPHKPSPRVTTPKDSPSRPFKRLPTNIITLPLLLLPQPLLRPLLRQHHPIQQQEHRPSNGRTPVTRNGECQRPSRPSNDSSVAPNHSGSRCQLRTLTTSSWRLRTLSSPQRALPPSTPRSSPPLPPTPLTPSTPTSTKTTTIIVTDQKVLARALARSYTPTKPDHQEEEKEEEVTRTLLETFLNIATPFSPKTAGKPPLLSASTAIRLTSLQARMD